MSTTFNRIQFYEGMLLEPQHFQQMDLMGLTYAVAYLRAANPFFWGLSELIIDQGALQGGRVTVLQAFGLFPDGTPFEVLPDDPDHPSMDLTQLANVDKTKPIPVYLGVIRYRPDAANLNADFPRYQSVQEGPFVDENTGTNEIYMPRLAVNISVLAGNEIPTRYVTFPLGEVLIQDDGYHWGDAIAPSVNILRSSPLNKIVTDIVNTLREKINFLVNKIAGDIATDGSPLLTKYTQILSILAPLCPRLEVMMITQNVHPFQVYMELCSIGGHLSTLIPGQNLPLFQPYQHDNLRGIFTPIADFIYKMLATIERLSVPALFQLEGRTFSLQLQPNYVFDGQLIISVSRLGATLDELTNWINGVVIANSDQINEARDMRVLGLPRQILTSFEPMGLMEAPGVIYISIAASSPSLDLSKGLVLLNESDTDQTRPTRVALNMADGEDRPA